MKKHTSEIIGRVLRNQGYIDNADGTFTHPYEQKLRMSLLEQAIYLIWQREKLKR